MARYAFPVRLVGSEHPRWDKVGNYLDLLIPVLAERLKRAKCPLPRHLTVRLISIDDLAKQDDLFAANHDFFGGETYSGAPGYWQICLGLPTQPNLMGRILSLEVVIHELGHVLAEGLGGGGSEYLAERLGWELLCEGYSELKPDELADYRSAVEAAVVELVKATALDYEKALHGWPAGTAVTFEREAIVLNKALEYLAGLRAAMGNPTSPLESIGSARLREILAPAYAPLLALSQSLPVVLDRTAVRQVGRYQAREDKSRNRVLEALLEDFPSALRDQLLAEKTGGSNPIRPGSE
jgi:hypothetical protein